MSGLEMAIPLIVAAKALYDLGQHIADNVRARRAARARAAKPCPPPVPAKARAKQRPTQDGKR